MRSKVRVGVSKKVNRWLLVGIAVILLVSIVGLSLWQGKAQTSKSPIKIGFVGAMTGTVTKYGSYEAVQLAVDDINKAGGINGREVELIAEDGKGDSKAAVDAINKLIDVDHVSIILGGHCTPESMAMAPIAQAKKVLMLASITTSPALSKFTNTGGYVVRTSPVSVVQADMTAQLAAKKLGLKKMGIVFEQTDYARPIAERVRDQFISNGGQVVGYDAVTQGTTDFRTILAKIKHSGADSIYMSAQGPDSALNFMQQVKQLGMENMKLFGNDVAGIPANIQKEPELYEGFMLALPSFDTTVSPTREFVADYNAKYGTKELPYGIWTAECYDATKLIAKEIALHGMDVDKIRNALFGLSSYSGVSGTFSIGEDGDGVRSYSNKIVRAGKIVEF